MKLKLYLAALLACCGTNIGNAQSKPAYPELKPVYLDVNLGIAKPCLDNKALGHWMDSTLGRPIGNGFQYITFSIDVTLPSRIAFGAGITGGIGTKRGTPIFPELKAGYNFLHTNKQALTLFATWGKMHYYISKVTIPGYQRLTDEEGKDLELHGSLSYYGLDLHYTRNVACAPDGSVYAPLAIDIEAGYFYGANPSWDLGYDNHSHDYSGPPNFGRNFLSVGISIGIGANVHQRMPPVSGNTSGYTAPLK